MSLARSDAKKNYGGFFRRLAAVLLDNFLYSAVTLPLIVVLVGPSYPQGAEVSSLSQMDPFTLAVRLFFAGLPYGLILIFWIKMGATPGKVLMECRIVDADSGARPGVKQAVLRLLGYLVSGPLTLGIGFLWVLWDKRKQGLHDKLANTVVRIEQEDYFYQSLPPLEQLACKH